MEPTVKAALKACGDGPSLPPVRLAADSCHAAIAAANLCFGSWLLNWFSSILGAIPPLLVSGVLPFKGKMHQNAALVGHFYLSGLWPNFQNPTLPWWVGISHWPEIAAFCFVSLQTRPRFVPKSVKLTLNTTAAEPNVTKERSIKMDYNH